ncbi:MAG: DUF922 domain-containing Zn-dependent protease [Elusimicrobia bacterium]|nr:DUF922 domain-containing Zn-dependent protease [Elusimicrobiota bacterium]
MAPPAAKEGAAQAALLAASFACVLLHAGGSAAEAVSQPRPEPPSLEALEPGLAVRQEVVYYPVTGRTAKDLRSQISASGPRERPNGRRYAAATEYRITWEFSYSRGPAGCSVTSAAVALALRQVYPFWTPPADAPMKHQRRWKRFSSALREHEAGHGDAALDGARSILRTITNAPPAASCGELAASTAAACRSVIRETTARMREDDIRTGHGRTQGALLP